MIEQPAPDLREEAVVNVEVNMQKISSLLSIKQLNPSGVFAGYGSVFGVKDRQGDVVDQGAFAKSIESHKKSGSSPALLMYHDPARPVGRYKRLLEDDLGLYVEGELAMGTAGGSEAYELMKSGALGGLSIGFVPVKTRYDQAEKANHIVEADLLEISLVTLPANPGAMVTSVKSISTPREFERFLVESGFSRNQAKSIAVGGYRGKAVQEDEEMQRVKDLLDRNIKLLSTMLR